MTSPTGFTPDAGAEYSRLTSNYSLRLEETSRAVAKNTDSTVIDKQHVLVAASTLNSNVTSKWPRRVGEVGFLLIGAAVGYLGNVIIGEQYTFANGAITFLPLALGFGMVAFSWARD